MESVNIELKHLGKHKNIVLKLRYTGMWSPHCGYLPNAKSLLSDKTKHLAEARKKRKGDGSLYE